MSEEPGYTEQRWSQHFEKIDLEIARHALACQIPLLDPGVIERVLRNDSLVCGRQNPRAFDSLRSLLMMHYSVHDNAVIALGEEETLKIVAEVHARLRQRIGDKLGTKLGSNPPA
jgi:hypothetical protein